MKELVGFAPAGSNVVDIQIEEDTDYRTSGNNIQSKINSVTLNVPEFLTVRRLYGYLNPKLVVGQPYYFVKGVVKLWLRGSVVGQIPWDIGATQAGTPFNHSLILPITWGGQQTRDTVLFYIGSPVGTDPASVIAQPFNMVGRIDKITYDVMATANVNGHRAILACVSTLNPNSKGTAPLDVVP